jgi:hypothetical protein
LPETNTLVYSDKEKGFNKIKTRPTPAMDPGSTGFGGSLKKPEQGTKINHPFFFVTDAAAK